MGLLSNDVKTTIIITLNRYNGNRHCAIVAVEDETWNEKWRLFKALKSWNQLRYFYRTSSKQVLQDKRGSIWQ